MIQRKKKLIEIIEKYRSNPILFHLNKNKVLNELCLELLNYLYPIILDPNNFSKEDDLFDSLLETHFEKFIYTLNKKGYRIKKLNEYIAFISTCYYTSEFNIFYSGKSLSRCFKLYVYTILISSLLDELIVMQINVFVHNLDFIYKDTRDLYIKKMSNYIKWCGDEDIDIITKQWLNKRFRMSFSEACQYVRNIILKRYTSTEILK